MPTVAMSTWLTLDDLVLALTGCPPRERPKLISEQEATRVNTVVVDSRQAVAGSLFVALRGEQTDGHRYIGDALGRGALCAIMDRMPEPGPEGTSVLDLRAGRQEGLWQEPRSVWGGGTKLLHLVVDDSLVALQALARWWRQVLALERKDELRVVGITGSLGKTTTKELVAAVLAQRYRVLKSRGNYNNEIGLPLTLLELTGDHQRAVLEMGTYGLGEIALLAQIACPDIGVVTNVGPVHLERMGTVERIAQAKAELVQALPEDGVAILNGDDEWVSAMAQQTRARVVRYGLTADCDVWAGDVESRGLDGVGFRLHHQDQSVHVHIPLLGWHSVHTALRAAAVGLVDGLSWDEIIDGLQGGEQLRLVAVPGVNGAVLLDDTYNSSPDSAIAALNLLSELGGRKIAVLGDMLELGGYAVEGHRRVGRRAIEVASILITVGELGRLIGQEALGCGMPAERVIEVADADAAVVCLQGLLQEKDMVLIKGSRGMAMERIVEALTLPQANDMPLRENQGG